MPSARRRFRAVAGRPIGLLRDLHDLYVMAAEVDMAWTLVVAE